MGLGGDEQRGGPHERQLRVGCGTLNGVARKSGFGAIRSFSFAPLLDI